MDPPRGGFVLTEENQLLKAQIFHANSVEKLPKIHEQMNNLLANLEKDDIVSVNTTEISFSGIQAFYSYTLLVVYRANA
jgi:hypothetical protein